MATSAVTPNSGTGSGSTSLSSASASATQVSEQQFFQLLVAQLQNQDPLNPMDGTQFVSQLAQFSELEQMIGVNQGVQQLVTDASSSSSTSSSSGNSGSSSASNSAIHTKVP
jgi:flagellar basal-body rod modification protein FlgD